MIADALEHDLLHDARARHADRAHDDDLAESFVHRHRHERRDEQKSDGEAHRAEDECELAEVAQPFVDLPHRRLRRDRRHARDRARFDASTLSTFAPGARLTMNERRAIASRRRPASLAASRSGSATARCSAGM